MPRATAVPASSRGPPRSECRVGDGNVHPVPAARYFDLRFQLIGECIDEGCAQAALLDCFVSFGPSDAVVGNRQLPIRPIYLVTDRYGGRRLLIGEGIFQSIDHEFGDDKTETDGIGRGDPPIV